VSQDSPKGGVAYVLRKFPVLSETFVLSELLGLEDEGVPLHVFSLMRGNDPRFHDDLPRLRARVAYVPELEGLAKLLRHHRRLARSEPRRYWRTLLYALRSGRPGMLWRFVQAGYVANEARRLRVRHFHAQFANRPTTVALLASRLTGIPFSFTAHATDIFKRRVSRTALARKTAEASFVVTVSEFNRRFLHDIVPDANGKVTVVHNGIDLDRFAPNGVPPWRPLRLLCVARLVEKKGIPVLVDACAELQRRGIDFELELVGKGLLRPLIERRIKDYGLEDRVRLAGPLTQLEVRERYGQAHVFVLACIVGSDGNRDGLPVSLVEALASGLPVVSTPVTAIPEVVRHEENGLLVPPGEPGPLADALARLASDRALYDRCRANARASVATTFDRRRTIARLQGLLEGSATS
jgi:colanic acid/amylovoran biosynthesis glycosyltransferase